MAVFPSADTLNLIRGRSAASCSVNPTSPFGESKNCPRVFPPRDLTSKPASPDGIANMHVASPCAQSKHATSAPSSAMVNPPNSFPFASLSWMPYDRLRRTLSLAPLTGFGRGAAMRTRSTPCSSTTARLRTRKCVSGVELFAAGNAKDADSVFKLFDTLVQRSIHCPPRLF